MLLLLSFLLYYTTEISGEKKNKKKKRKKNVKIRNGKYCTKNFIFAVVLFIFVNFFMYVVNSSGVKMFAAAPRT